jgi:hypothetical protein
MDTVTIPLTQGKFAVIDAADADRISGYHWYTQRREQNFYAIAHDPQKHARLILMHRLILDPPDGLNVDHADGNGLNNRRANLRLTDRAGNKRNGRLPKNNRSGYKGVYWKARRQRWEVQIRVDGRLHHVGYFRDREEAARAYDAAAREAFGPFARTNFPE